MKSPEEIFDILKAKYTKLGYFDNKNKKSIKDDNKLIGIITSIKGAALRDRLEQFLKKAQKKAGY